MKQAREGSENPRKLLGGRHEHRRSVLAGEPELKGSETGAQGASLPLVHRLGGAQLLNRRVGDLEKSVRLFILVIKTKFTLVEAGNLDLNGLELGLGRLPALARLRHRGLEPVNFIGPCLKP